MYNRIAPVTRLNLTGMNAKQVGRMMVWLNNPKQVIVGATSVIWLCRKSWECCNFAA